MRNAIIPAMAKRIMASSEALAVAPGKAFSLDMASIHETMDAIADAPLQLTSEALQTIELADVVAAMGTREVPNVTRRIGFVS